MGKDVYRSHRSAGRGMGYFSTPCPVIKEVEIEYQLGDPGPVVRKILSQIPARVKIDVVVPWSLFVRIYTRFMLEVGNGTSKGRHDVAQRSNTGNIARFGVKEGVGSRALS